MCTIVGIAKYQLSVTFTLDYEYSNFVFRDKMSLGPGGKYFRLADYMIFVPTMHMLV
jgi:hypothetical protein